MNLKHILTWVPAFAFPLSHLVQIDKMVRSGQVGDVSPATFYGYFLGNMGAYLFTEKYADPRTIFAYLLTAFLEIVIVSLTQIGTYFFVNKYNDEEQNMYEKNKYKLWSILLSAIIISIFVYYAINYQQKYIKRISSFAGFFPAIFFPLATFFQIWRIIKTGQPTKNTNKITTTLGHDKLARTHLHGVSCKAWILQIVANIGAYLLTDKLTNLKSITAFLLTAILDVIIIGLIYFYSGSLWECVSLKNLFE